MFAFRGAFGSTGAERARGGLHPDAMEESSSSASDDAEEAPTQLPQDYPNLVLPEPRNAALLVSPDGSEVCADMSRVPSTIKGIPVQAGMGIAALRDEALEQKADFGNALFLPGLVATSPMLMVLQSLPMPSTSRVPVPSKPELVKAPRYMPAGFVAYKLNEFKIACFGGSFPHPPSMTPERRKAIADHYVEYGRRLVEKNRAAYKAFCGSSPEGDMDVTAFLAACEARTLAYIHLTEWYLYSCIIEPHSPTALPLESLLTPHEFPVPSDAQRVAIHQHVRDFFEHKQLSVPRTRIRVAAYKWHEQPLYKNYLPYELCRDYALDVAGQE